MCKAPKMPTPPAPLPAPQAAKTPISLPNRRKRSGLPGTAAYSVGGAMTSLLGGDTSTGTGA